MTAEELADARAKQRTALVSVAAAIVLVGAKLTTGLITGSLAFVAEAAHSATDLVAALLTLFAVRVATRPPDEEHHYGHGKAEHLAALGESGFLLLVSVFIGFESLRRLLGEGHGAPEAAWWAFMVLALVIALDFSRALISHRMARRHESPALAANALHFSSDLAGSLAVLIGLVLVAVGYPDADAIAALFVAALVVIAALRLARQSVDVLMDRASHDAEDLVRTALTQLEDPVELRRLRVRHAAGTYFVDLVIAVAPDAGVSQAHAIADHVEDRVHRALGRADMVVHVEPAEAAAGDLRERATVAAMTVPEVREVHNVRALDVDGHPELSLHVKLPQDLSLTQAHDAVERLEVAIKQALPELHGVHTHIEPLAGVDHASMPESGETAVEREAVSAAVRHHLGEAAPVSVRFRDGERGRIALVTVGLPGEQPLPSAHSHAGAIEEAVRQRCPSLADVIVHTEPVAERSSS
jgi:cation diffusion facilitator family transporter